MLNYTLGTIEASEALIKDLYIDLRAKVNAWSKITQQTPQARMGYVGQHLVSVVTGYPGGKSGARGYDLVIDDERHGEIKTCYRVDQLGSCNACGAVVSSLETECAVCRSTSINRKDDSKWLIAIRNNDEFAKLLDPYRYYFVLFEFESIYDSNNNDIIASIWEVDPKSKGFAYCMIDYYLNIRSQSTSKAPFNMWPHMLKFALTEPTLIYRSKITNDGNIITDVFPSKNNTYSDVLLPLSSYSGSTTISVANIKNVIKKYSPSARVNGLNKEKLLQRPSHILCKPPRWCIIEAPQWRFYYGKRETHTGRKCPQGKDQRAVADGEHRQHGRHPEPVQRDDCRVHGKRP